MQHFDKLGLDNVAAHATSSGSFPSRFALSIFTMFQMLMEKAMRLQLRRLPDLAADLAAEVNGQYHTIAASLVMSRLREGGVGGDMITQLLEKTAFDGD